MATAAPPRQQPSASGSRHSVLVRTIATVLLALIVMVGLAILIIWLAIKPKKPLYSIDDGSIHNFNLSNGNHLNASYNFVLRTFNPNKKVSVYYDKVDIMVLYDDETIASGVIDPWYQPKRNATRFKLDLASRDVSLSGSVARDLKLEKSSGRVEVDVKLKARIRFKVGGWKSRHYHMKILCAPVLAHFSTSSKGFQRTLCDVDI